MLRIKERIALLLSFLFVASFSQLANAQIGPFPVSWMFTVEQTPGSDEATLIFTADIDQPWHMYATELPRDDGPIASTFSFNKNANYKLVGKIQESEYHTEYDPNFDMDLNWHTGKATFKQKIKILGNQDFTVAGELECMVCNDETCLPPELTDFSFQVKVIGGDKAATSEPTQDDHQANAPPQANPFGNAAGMGDMGLGGIGGNANSEEPVFWKYSAKKIDATTYKIEAKASIEHGWHVYSAIEILEDGPNPCRLAIDKTNQIVSIGEVEEAGNIQRHFEEVFEGETSYYEQEVTFSRTITVEEGFEGDVTGEIEFQACIQSLCLPPTPIPFKVNLKTGKGKENFDEPVANTGEATGALADFLGNIDPENPIGDCGAESAPLNAGKTSNWLMFLFGIIEELERSYSMCFPNDSTNREFLHERCG